MLGNAETERGGVKEIGLKNLRHVLLGEIESERNNKFVFLGPRKVSIFSFRFCG